METFTEAEIQALIAHLELSRPIETPNNNFYSFYPKTNEEAGKYFRRFLEDWQPAYKSLVEKKLLIPDSSGYIMTEEGEAEATRLRLERPPIWYWYKEFYSVAPHSRAYGEYCRRLYGKNLCQAGFSSMLQIDSLLKYCSIQEGSRALDLGCGLGMVAEYLSDRSKAHFTGVDYCETAIQMAQERARSKHNSLDYLVMNMDNLDFHDNTFDLILSIDTLYMPSSLETTLKHLKAMLRPGGMMAVYYIQFVWDCQGDRAGLFPENTPLGAALRRLGLNYRIVDFTKDTFQLMQRKHEIGEELKSKFEAEGNGFIYEFIRQESLESHEVFNTEQCPFSRYLYLID